MATVEPSQVIVIGGGLAGSEAAWQVAERGVPVILYEMRPHVSTPAHKTDLLAELVCSNSLGSDLPDRAPGLLKQELRRLGSLILRCADACRGSCRGRSGRGSGRLRPGCDRRNRWPSSDPSGARRGNAPARRGYCRRGYRAL